MVEQEQNNQIPESNEPTQNAPISEPSVEQVIIEETSVAEPVTPVQPVPPAPIPPAPIPPMPNQPTPNGYTAGAVGNDNAGQAPYPYQQPQPQQNYQPQGAQQSTYQTYRGSYPQSQESQGAYQQTPVGQNPYVQTVDPSQQQPYGYQAPQNGVPPYPQQPQQPYYGQQPPYQGMPVKNHKTMVTLCGVFSIVAGLISPLAAFILGAIAIIFANKDKKTFGPDAFPKAGFICGIIGICVGAFMWFASIAIMFGSGYYF